MSKVITIVNDKLVVDENVLGIPELKAVYDFYEGEDRTLAFCYLHFLYDLESPYRGVPVEDREDQVKKDYKGKYKPKFDKVMIKAAEKMQELNYSAIGDLLDGLKSNIKSLSNELRQAEITTGRDGNINQFVALHKSIASVAQNFRSVEQDFLQEVEKTRGNYRRAIDEDDDY